MESASAYAARCRKAMARIYYARFSVLFFLLLLIDPSHTYPNRQGLPYQGRDYVVEHVVSEESAANDQTLAKIQIKLNANTALKESLAQLLTQERHGNEKRWRGHHRGNNENRPASPALQQIQQDLEDLSEAIQSLYDLLSSNFNIHTRLSATATSTSTAYHTTTALPSSSSTISTTRASANGTTATASIPNNTAGTGTSTSHLTVSTAARYSFDPMASSNVAVYYGQTDQTSAVPLSTICSDSQVDIVVLAFIHKLSTGAAAYPGLNMGPHCWAATSAQADAGATGLIDCVSDGFANQVKSCQTIGKKVLLSIGGAVGYSETTIASDADAERIAHNIWNLFGAGGLNYSAILAIRPFGDFVFDGFDIDNEDGSTAHWPSLISRLRHHFQHSTTSKPYYLTATPQCPRPDASIPLSSMQTQLDYIFIQFYNNPACNFNSPSFLASLQAWSDDLSNPATLLGFVDTGNGVASPRIYIGAPAFPAAGSGWVGGQQFSSLLADVKQLADGNRVGNLGGVMLWDGAYGELSGRTDGAYGRTGVGKTYMKLVKEVLG